MFTRTVCISAKRTSSTSSAGLCSSSRKSLCMWRLAVYIVWAAHSPLHIPQVRGEGSEVKGWVAACLSWRRGAGGEGPLTQRLSWVWEERSLLLLLLPPAHLAAPRTLIWRENKNVFISQEKRRTLEWKPQKLKHRESYWALTQAAVAGMVTSFSALSNSFKLSAALLLVSLFFRFSPIIYPCIFTITHLNQGPDPSPKSSYTCIHKHVVQKTR